MYLLVHRVSESQSLPVGVEAVIGGRFVPLTIMSKDNTDIDSMITTVSTAVTETASEILGKHRQKKTLDHCRNS